MRRLGDLCARLPKDAAKILLSLSDEQALALEEVRLYLGAPMELVIGGKRVMTALDVDRALMDALLASLSGFALYRFDVQMAQGYMPLMGGHRAGICGSMVQQADGTWRMSCVTSVCLRVARRVQGASLPIQKSLLAEGGRVRRTLLFGPPGCGKTTVLRDAAAFLAQRVHTAVVDEREELFAQEMGAGQRLDVLCGADKARAFSMLIRSMGPQAIVCDEIGRDEDVDAVLDAARCGVGLLASAHADSMDDLLARPALRRLFDAGAFERYIHLGRRGSVRAVFDQYGSGLEGEGEEHALRCGDDGDDRGEQRRLFALGR